MGKTKIFARGARGGERQWLAYSMSFSAKDEMALILPIPTALGAGEDAVRFIDLSGYPTFFDDIDKLFERPLTRGFAPAAMAPQSVAKLVVHEVGHLEASFVPTVNDFARLDERFKLQATTWDQLPVQKTYGFVVVKLGKNATQQNVHPIAFDFPRRDQQRVFFPTLHVHDGKVHKTAKFDHSLYAQSDTTPWDRYWLKSTDKVSARVNEAKTNGLVNGDAVAYMAPIIGDEPNDDIWF